MTISNNGCQIISNVAQNKSINCIIPVQDTKHDFQHISGLLSINVHQTYTLLHSELAKAIQ